MAKLCDKFLYGFTTPTGLRGRAGYRAKIFVARMLTHDLFAVANLHVDLLRGKTELHLYTGNRQTAVALQVRTAYYRRFTPWTYG